MMAVSARREVLRLYKRLLRLHERLPGDFSTLGQRFVQEEFKKHKSVSQEQAKMFTKEWTEYASSLESQLLSSAKSGHLDVGRTVQTDELELLHDGQVGQLYQLHQEIAKHKPDQGSTNS